MSGLALLLLEMGLVVSGSDEADSAALKELSDRGVQTFVGHDANNTRGATTITWSPAVAIDNVEVSSGRATGCRVGSSRKSFGRTRVHCSAWWG